MKQVTLPLAGFFPQWVMVRYDDSTPAWNIAAVEIYSGPDCHGSELLAVKSFDLLPPATRHGIRCELETWYANKQRREHNLARLAECNLKRTPDFREGRREYRLQPLEVAQQDGFPGDAT